MNVLYTARQARLGDLQSYAGTVVRDLYRYVADLDLLVCGPQYWFYYGVDGRPLAAGGAPQDISAPKFTLEVALPVEGKIPTALLPFFKQIPAFRCLSSRYEGPWEGIAQEYDKMMGHIKENQLRMNGIYAESFLHIDTDHPENQITEILIGLC